MNRLLHNSLPVLILLIMCLPSYSQTGTLAGIVIDGDHHETIIGATIYIPEIRSGTATDPGGRFIIRNIPAGTYTLIVSCVGYQKLTITDVTIPADGHIHLDLVMTEGITEMEAVTISAYRQNNTIESVITDIRRLPQVISGISGQQISQSMDSDAAQVMQRVPGVTIVDSRFVMIRGLSERYNSVMINNVPAPSTEVDKRSFSFDLISSSALDRVLIYKSGSADLPGDYASGVIKLFTVDQVDHGFLKINMGAGFRYGTTGRTFYQSRGSSTDLLGFDNGFRKLPSGFPDTYTLQGTPRNAPLRQESALMLPNNFEPLNGTALADHSLGVEYGHNFTMGDLSLFTITSVNLSNGYTYYERDFLRYFEWENRNQPILKRFAYVDDTYLQESKLNVMTNWTLAFNKYHSLRFKNLFNQIGENETIIRSGFDYIQRPNDLLRNYLLGYRSRSIYTGQLEGRHEFRDPHFINWAIGLSYLNESEPDLRRFRTFLDFNDPDQRFSMQMPPSSNLFDTGRYYGSLKEWSINQGVDYKIMLSDRLKLVKAGYLVDYRNRNFNSRYLSYLYPGFFNPETREELIRLPLNQIFDYYNIRLIDGFVIEEGTRPIDSYKASSFTIGTYASSEYQWHILSVTGGIRTEYNLQELISQDDFQEILVNNPVFSVLPFLNLSLPVNNQSQVRFAYSRTVNRPEFRELAPFVFYDYKLDAGRAGNPELTTATIDNVDLRLEWYPRIGEVLSAGFFYKYFNNPIENRTTITTESPQFSYINADNAWAYGIEMEVRKSFLGMTEYEVLDRFAASINASLIYSEVDLGITAVAQDRHRSLQGQSPYILNLAVYYDDVRRGLSGSLIYNIIGPRIYSVGDVLFPTIYEIPRHSLDVTANWKVSGSTTLKAGVQNVLNAKYSFLQDSNRNNKPDSDDHTIFKYASGPHVSVSATYSF